MQTTLLGLAIAFILALVAALVGPFFIDWSQFRPQFEAEATRIVGAPVRVIGALDARLLPAPSMQLHGITIGGANDLGRFRADKLDVEFSLGSLLRGEWRATELTVGGAAVDLGLNAQGRVDLPASTGSFNLGALAIDRLNVTGRASLHDAASRSSLELGDIAFSGDVRSLAAGAMRGDGNFTLSGTRYPFRVSSGQSGDGNGTRVRLTIDPGEKPVSIDIDGVLTFINRAPAFEGGVVLARSLNPKADQGKAPWRISSKIKVDPSQAQFEAVEASYGADERALRLSGVADFRFGQSPLLQAVLSAKQLDLDRLLAKEAGADDGATPVATLLKAMASAPQPPVATRLAVSAEQIMLGGKPLQNVGADLHGDARSWAVERLEFRAPGATRVTVSGAAMSPNEGGGFKGAVNVESADPDTLASWIKGRAEVRLRDQRPLRIRGNFVSAAERLAIDNLNAEIDGGSLQGRIALAYPSAPGGTRIDADLKADRLDLDAAVALIRSLGGPQAEWPDAGQISLDIGRAISAGQEMRPFLAQFGYSAKAISLDRFKVGEATGLMLDGSGTFDRTDATGKFAVSAGAPSLALIGSIIAPIAPTVAARINAMPATPGATKLRLALELTKSQSSVDRANARLVFDIDAPQVKGATTITASPKIAAMQVIDTDALLRSEWSVDSRLTGAGSSILPLLGLDGLVVAGTGPLAFEGNVSGASQSPLRIKAKLAGPDLDVDVQGSAEPWAATPKAALTLAVRKANAAPLFDIPGADAMARDVTLTSRVALNGDKLSFEDIDSMLAGSRMRGRLALTLGSAKSIDGQIGTDNIDLASMFGLVIGARGHDASEPLGRGLLQGLRGQLAFQALSATLPGGAELRPLSGVVKSDGASLTIDAIKGKIGSGDVSADIDLKSVPSTGYALSARVEVSGADGKALRYRSLAMPAGKTSLRMSLTSQGRSASALAGAISGNGLLTVDRLRIAGLDPRAFDVAIRASDTGQATDDTKLRQIVEQALPRGDLAIASAQIPFVIKDSRLRVSAAPLDAEGARVIVSGGYDIVADQADMRTSLTGVATGASSVRPEIQIFTVGSPDRLDRTVDVASLSSWLAVRAIDRETRRLDALERGERPPVFVPAAIPPPASAPPENAPAVNDVPASSAPAEVPIPRRPPAKAAAPRPPTPSSAVPPVASQQIAPLPAPVEVRPPPGSAGVRQDRPRPSAPLIITPPAAVPATRPPL